MSTGRIQIMIIMDIKVIVMNIDSHGVCKNYHDHPITGN